MHTILTVMLLVNVTSLSNTQRGEIRRVEERLLAPGCYTQSIAVHRSEIAGQMRAEVTEMVVQGQTDEQIVNHYRNLYGDRVLIVPDGVTGKVLFSLPVVTSILGCLVLYVCFRKMLRVEKRISRTARDQKTHGMDRSLREKIEREIGEPF